jgi:predicted nucleotidyltransferase
MSHSVLTNILEQLDSLSLDEKRILSNHLGSLSELNKSVINRSRLKVIESKKRDILDVANDYSASNIRYVREDKEVIFIVDLAKNRSLFDLAGLLESLRELLGFEVVVFTESMIKEQYRESIINNSIKL